MPNQIKATAENPDELLNAGAYGAGALIRLQSAATQAGAFADLTGTGSTPTLPLVAGVQSYTGYDPNGTSTTWYRSRFENAAASRVSDWATPFQVGIGGVCSIYDVKTRMGITDTIDDALIQILCNGINGWVTMKCRRVLAPIPDATYIFDGSAWSNRGKVLVYPNGIRSVTSFKIADATGQPLDLIPAADYVLRPLDQERPPGFPATRLMLTDLVTGAHAYVPRGYGVSEIVMATGFASVPEEVAELATTAVIRAYEARRSGQVDIIGTDETGAPIVSRFISERDRATLEYYRWFPGVTTARR